MTPDDPALVPILRESRTVAVVGLSPDPARPSHGVARYLQEAGYRIIPVRPGGGWILGELVRDSLTAAREAVGPIDVVNVFRRREALAGLEAELVAVRPRLIWMQVGVRDEGVAARLEAAGIPTVMDRCLMVDHAWLLDA